MTDGDIGAGGSGIVSLESLLDLGLETVFCGGAEGGGFALGTLLAADAERVVALAASLF